MFEIADSKRVKGKSMGNGFEFELPGKLRNVVTQHHHATRLLA